MQGGGATPGTAWSVRGPSPTAPPLPRPPLPGVPASPFPCRPSGRRMPPPEPGRPRARGGARPRVTDPEAAAREICLRLLSASPRTRAQLADALRRKDIPDDVAERVLGRFTDVGLIDDEAFAQAWVQSRHTGRGLARRALAQELRHRGVADDTVTE